ncbi:diguanylate cyclase [Lysobacter ciconiae]|uniref:diguanylate cyclase n=1 Tax=Novilysobacter ciconiae TaxID=2781022 RepID=A0A7S6UG47_9GAMM|nr:diguanylate cyclase [Lysobacter ciconiae]QOW19651.1 diguanylate cyclase [Lysobacter ciconiae]
MSSAEHVPVPPQLLAGRRARILVVDDQPTNILTLHRLFEDEHDMFMATGGEQALAFCRSTPPDLVLLDVVMPEPGGLAVCRALAADPVTRDIPVIFVTGVDDPDGEAACWDAGGVDFITKPFNARTVSHRVRAHLMLKQQADLLRRLAWVDGLTGIANRRHFDDCLRDEWNRCARLGSPLSLVSFDIDHFKRFNDSLGHLAGDDALRAVAAAAAGCVSRPGDLVARTGGEEFAALLSHVDAAGAATVAEHIRQAVADLAIGHPATERGRVSVSVGVATVVPTRDGDPIELLAAADRALYAAKADGRDRVRVAPALAEPALSR